MNKERIRQINETIATYMGLQVHGWDKDTGAVYYKKLAKDYNFIYKTHEQVDIEYVVDYTTSFDKLLPVWEFLNVYEITFNNQTALNCWECILRKDACDPVWGEDETATMTQAAAEATSNLIKLV